MIISHQNNNFTNSSFDFNSLLISEHKAISYLFSEEQTLLFLMIYHFFTLKILICLDYSKLHWLISFELIVTLNIHILYKIEYTLECL